MLVMAELLGRAPAATFICVVPQMIGEGTEMTSLMPARFELVEDLLLTELKRLDVKVERCNA